MSDGSNALPEASKVPEIRAMEMSDISFALWAGWRDFRRKPMMGLFFSLIYVVGGWLIYTFLFVTEQIWWALPITAGFPLLAPFLAVGLYEVSRRLEQGDTGFRPNDIFGVVWRQRLRQLPLMSWVIIIYFLFWSFFAHMLFAMFIGPSVLINPSAGYSYLLQPEGLMMLVVGNGLRGGLRLHPVLPDGDLAAAVAGQGTGFRHGHADQHRRGQSEPPRDDRLGRSTCRADLPGDAACVSRALHRVACAGTRKLAYLSSGSATRLILRT